MKDIMLIKLALPKSAFNLALIPALLPNQQFDTCYIREYHFDETETNADFLYTQYINYTDHIVAKKLLKLLENQNFFCEASGSDSYYWITKLNTTVLFTAALPCADFYRAQREIEYTFHSLFRTGKALSGYISCILDPWWIQSSFIQPSLFFYRRLQHSRYNNCIYSQDILSKKFLSDEIWCPICWKVWVNCRILQSYLNLLSFSDLVESEQITETSWKFQFYSTPIDFTESSRQKIIQLLENSYTYSTNSDCKFEINHLISRNEATLQLIQYLDRNNNLASKRNAVYQEISTYLLINDSTGQLLSRKKYTLS